MAWGQCYGAHGMKIPWLQMKMSVWQVCVASSGECFWQIWVFWVFFKYKLGREKQRNICKFGSSLITYIVRNIPVFLSKKSVLKKKGTCKFIMIMIILIKLSISPGLKMKCRRFNQKKAKYFWTKIKMEITLKLLMAGVYDLHGLFQS